MTKTGVILHRVTEAEDCISRNLHRGNLLFSTHVAVDVYLRERYAVDCQCLSRFWETDEVIAHKNAVSPKVDRILEDLDRQIAPWMNEVAKLQMRYFVPLYSYLGKHSYCGFSFFIASIKKIIIKYNLDNIIMYNNKTNSFFNNPTEYHVALPKTINKAKINIIDLPSIPHNKISNYQRLFSICIRYPNYLYSKGRKLYFRNIKFRIKRLNNNFYNLCLLEDLYDLNFLKEKLSHYNIFQFVPQEYSWGGKRNLWLGLGWQNLFAAPPQRHQVVPLHLFDIPVSDNLEEIFLADIKADFLCNINQYLQDLASLRSFQADWPPALAIWGNSPVNGFKALLVEYLRSTGVPILGGQHGGLYGEVYEPWHFDADFDRCDFYISYGFTKEDLRRVYPDRKLDLTIFPLGASTATGGRQAKTPIDILFPLTNSLSLFDGGMARGLPDRLAEVQIALLEHLDSLAALDIYIKPFMFSDYHNSAVIPVLQRLKRVKVIDYMQLKDFLRRYHPKIILIEFPSMPLYDSLHLDCEILLLDNPVFPFSQDALEKLRKRVHYCQNCGEMIAKLDLFLQGRLPKKRDASFYRHYVYKPDFEKNVLSLIDTLVSQRQPLGRRRR